MRGPERIRTALVELEQSARYIQRQGRRRKQVVFDDPRAWQWFGQEAGVLAFENPYSCVWTLRALEDLNRYLEVHIELKGYRVEDQPDALVDHRVSDLLVWLLSWPANTRYLEKARQFAGAPLDAQELLELAQYWAVNDVFEGVFKKVNGLWWDAIRNGQGKDVEKAGRVIVGGRRER